VRLGGGIGALVKLDCSINDGGLGSEGGFFIRGGRINDVVDDIEPESSWALLVFTLFFFWLLLSLEKIISNENTEQKKNKTKIQK
jgi:hypothetical protein